MNLTGFLICIITHLSDRTFRFMYFRHFFSQSHVLSFSECLNAMPVGSDRRADKEYKWWLKAKLRNLSRCPGQVSVEFCIIHFKSGLLNR